jgi:Ca2+-binding EF-hand superfamily protein
VAFGNLFERADANRDGYISQAEFAAAPQRQPRAAKPAERARGGRMVAAADIDKGGRVALAEVQQLTLRRFDHLDLNRDGTVTSEERMQGSAQRRSS